MVKPKNIKTLGIIPARLGSTRLPRKMLLPINGKPLIYWTWKQTKKAKLLDEVIIATDVKEIYDVVTGFGGTAVMTSMDCPTGSDRVAEAARKFPTAEIIINIQGDEPMISPVPIDAVARALQNDKTIPVATAGTYITDQSVIQDVNKARIVVDKNSNALYFSRAVIPYPRKPCPKYIKHVSIYGFRKKFLQTFVKLPQTFAEQIESLEQLRILEHGYRMRVVIGDFESASVDTAEDLAYVRRLMDKNKKTKKQEG